MSSSSEEVAQVEEQVWEDSVLSMLHLGCLWGTGTVFFFFFEKALYDLEAQRRAEGISFNNARPQGTGDQRASINFIHTFTMALINKGRNWQLKKETG